VKKNLAKAFKREILFSHQSIGDDDLDKAFLHLERAHILGQKFVWAHFHTHVLMLYIAFLRKDYNEVLGQILRIPLGVLGSGIGIVPVGNSGGANVSLFRKMDIPADLESYLNDE